MIELLGASGVSALAGLLGGIVLGLAARLGRFCTLGAIEDLFYGESDARLRMWAVAIGVAVIGTFALIGAEALDPAQTLYLGQTFNPFASVLGGLAFGYGMALAGNCGYGALARLGGGDMRAFVVVLVLGVASYATLSGPLARLRVWAFPHEMTSEPPGIAHGLSLLTGLPEVGLGIAIGILLLVGAIAGKSLRQNPAQIGWGATVGLAIVSGFGMTQWISDESLSAVPVVSHTFSAPPGESLLWLMTASGSSLSFGIGSVAGVLAGAFAGSLVKGHFRWEACDDPRELKRQIAGAALMGVGAVIAVGCTVGQGMSAFALLAYSAPLTLAAIFAGAAVGLRQLITGWAPDA